jgi:hypothetical protein
VGMQVVHLQKRVPWGRAFINAITFIYAHVYNITVLVPWHKNNLTQNPTQLILGHGLGGWDFLVDQAGWA